MDFLIVDDVAFMRKIIIDILTNYCDQEESKIYEAEDGESAVSEYKRIKPGMVFLDVLMPGKSGTETVSEIINFDPDAYIVMCSSANEEGIIDDCAHAGAKDYIIKPIDPTRMKAALKKRSLEK